MNKYILSIFCSFAALPIMAQSEASICINELMQSNVNELMLEYDFPDSWVELYNPTTEDIDLFQFYIGNSEDFQTAYRFTTHDTLRAGGYSLILCDKVNSDLHTNFRLESTDPGTVYLFDSLGVLIDSKNYPAMISIDVAFGRISDGEDVWGWELIATPGAANAGGHTTEILPSPIFSNIGGVRSGSEIVSITMPEGTYPEDTRIYITTDGTEPSCNSASGESFVFNIEESMVIRAKLISASALCSKTITNSYIFHPRNTTFPIVSIASDENYFFSDSIGIFSDSLTNGQANYKYEWRRPVNAEFLCTNGDTPWFNQVGEVAVGGSATRSLPQKTIKLFANKRFGTKRLKGVFWAEKPNVTKVKSFSLRNGGNNFATTRINDALIQRLFGTHVSNIDYQAYAPAITYINGEYYGLVGIRERTNEDYVESNYDGLEDIYMATSASYKPYKAGIAERATNNFEPFYQLYRSDTTSYATLAQYMDVDNFMKTMIAEMTVPNTDFPHNNISIWRNKADNGKWKWILKDMDFFSVTPNRSPLTFNMFNYLLGPIPDTPEYSLAKQSYVIECCKLYKKMISFPEFREAFIDAFATYLGDFVKPSVFVALCDNMLDEIKEEQLATFDYYQNDENLEYWSDFLRSHCQYRAGIVYQQLADFFELGDVIPMTLLTNGTGITMNGIGLTEGNFDGAYFSNRELRLVTDTEDMGWKMQLFKFNADSIMEQDAFKDTLFLETDILLRLADYEHCDSISFSVVPIEEKDFDRKLRELNISQSLCEDWSSKTAISIPEPRYAYANITNIEAIPETKNDNLHAYISFFDNNGNFFRKKILLNRQGSNTTPKENFSISFCEDEWEGEETPTIGFGDWALQDEFHLKGFYNDGLRGTAEIAYQLYSQITDRANCYPKAFPVSIYINGDFYGVMSWQLKKHRLNMGLDKKNSAHVWLDGTLNDKQLFQDTINWTKFEIRNPKDLYNMDGSDYNGDFPQEIIDATSEAWTGKNKMVRCAEAKQHIIDFSHYCSELKSLAEEGSSEDDMRTAIAKHFDVPELINYMIFSLVSNNYDGFSKNWQWFTNDGIMWSVAPYDCDFTFGYNDSTYIRPAGMSSKKYDYRMENVDSEGPMYWIKNYYWEDLKIEYSNLRKSGVISTANIMTLVNQWYNRISEENYDEEWQHWPDSPCIVEFQDDPERFREWINERITLEDEYLDYLPISDSYTFNISEAEWATLCVPFSFSIPEGISVYTVSGIASDGVSLLLDKVANPIANKPYLINGPANEYTIEGEVINADESADDYLTNGLLTGTLCNIYAPADSYVLQDLYEEVGFYYVPTANNMPLTHNHAYLTTEATARLGHFRICDETEGIRNTTNTDGTIKTTLNYWGQRTNATSTGIYFQVMPDGSCRKVFLNK